MRRCHLGINVTVTHFLPILRVVTEFLRKQPHFSFAVRLSKPRKPMGSVRKLVDFWTGFGRVDGGVSTPAAVTGWACRSSRFCFIEPATSVTPGYQECSPLRTCWRRGLGGVPSFTGSSTRCCQPRIKVTVTHFLPIRRVVTQFLRKQRNFSFTARQAIGEIVGDDSDGPRINSAGTETSDSNRRIFRDTSWLRARLLLRKKRRSYAGDRRLSGISLRKTNNRPGEPDGFENNFERSTTHAQ